MEKQQFTTLIREGSFGRCHRWARRINLPEVMPALLRAAQVAIDMPAPSHGESQAETTISTDDEAIILPFRPRSQGGKD